MTEEQRDEARRIMSDAAARRNAQGYVNTGLIVLTFIVIMGMIVMNALRRDRDDAIVERDRARVTAAAWKSKDEANYPLVRQWRTAYEDLKGRCIATSDTPVTIKPLVTK